MKTLLYILLAVTIITTGSKAQTTISYETATTVITSVNLALTTLNASGITPKWQAKYTEGLAILTGAGQLAYGIYEAGSSMSTLDIVNITAGAVTIITNSILLYNNLKTGKSTSWNFYYSPLKKNKPEFGIRIVKSF